MTDESWDIADGPNEIESYGADSVLFRFVVTKGDEERPVIVALSSTLLGGDPGVLPFPLGKIVATKGEAAVREFISRDRVPARISVSTAGAIEDIPDEPPR